MKFWQVGDGVLPEKGLLEKTTTTKRFKYLQWGSEMKKWTSFTEVRYQKFDDPTINKYNRSNPIYNPDFSFHEFSDTSKFEKICFESKFSRLTEFPDHLNNCANI